MMKKYLVLGFFAVLLLFSSSGMDTIPPKVERAAKMKTDSQLNAISERQGPDRLVIHFDRLRRHIDSLNSLNMIARDSFIRASTERDSIMTALLITITDNTRLREENEKFQTDIDYALRLPTLLMLMIMMISAVLIGKGIFRGWEKHIADKPKNL